jgi:uncharacterized protein YndB with AHSA1/START domain
MERTAAEGVSVERVVEIAASPESVWSYLVDPVRALRWWGRTISFDLRPGGALRVEVTIGSVASGAFVEINPPRRLVYTFGWELGGAGPELVPPGSSTVEIDLLPAGDGTRLRLVHRGLPVAHVADAHAEGWDHYLPRLAIAAADGEPGPDPWQSPTT